MVRIHFPPAASHVATVRDAGDGSAGDIAGLPDIPPGFLVSAVASGRATSRVELVLSQPFIDDLPQKSVIDPSQIGDLHNELWPNPMNPRQHQRRPETGGPRRRDVERCRRRSQILAFSQTKVVAGRE